MGGKSTNAGQERQDEQQLARSEMVEGDSMSERSSLS